MPAAALALASALASRTPTRVDHHVYGVGRWRLEVTHDGFAASTTCRLAQGRAVVHDGRLVWSLGPKVDTLHAVVRIDGGAPHVQSERDLPASANTGNPSDGRVVIPLPALVGARRVQVRVDPRHLVHGLTVARLDEAAAAAERLGCAPL